MSISLITKRILEVDTDLTALVTLFLSIPVQIGAGLIASFAAWVVDKETFYFVYTDDVKTSQAIFCEMIFTMLLCMNVHGTDQTQRGLFLEGVNDHHDFGNCLIHHWPYYEKLYQSRCIDRIKRCALCQTPQRDR